MRRYWNGEKGILLHAICMFRNNAAAIEKHKHQLRERERGRTTPLKGASERMRASSNPPPAFRENPKRRERGCERSLMKRYHGYYIESEVYYVVIGARK